MSDYHYNEDGSPTMRELAHINNPLIGSAMIGDTINNVANAIGFLQEISIGMSENDALSERANHGYFMLMQCLRSALKFESHELDE